MNRSDGLTHAEISSVRTSFDRMWPMSTQMVDMFYDRLFEILPESRAMFRGDMVTLKRNFISTLAVIVGSLDSNTGLLSLVGKLAEDHVHYGVRPEHYAAVENALLWSLGQGLGTFWTAEVEQAWRKILAQISERMIAAAYR